MKIVKQMYEKVFGSVNKQTLKQYQKIVEQINALEDQFTPLSDQELQGKTQVFKERLAAGESLDDILPEAFATVREVGRRVLGMRHFDVQLIGGIALHQGKIAEMRTGEGKTLVATLPAYLNALEGKGVHVVTVNDYLARRDAVWMAKIYDFLGMSIGVVQNLRVSYQYDPGVQVEESGGEEDMEAENAKQSFQVAYDHLRPISRKEAYLCDITYGTNNEFGFDYLRDNMVQDIEEMVMRPGSEMHYALIDEIDSILIDEARTPLIISAPREEAAEQYYQFAKLVRQLEEETDYNVDEKLRSATLTESGISKFENWLGIENIYVEGGIRTIHHIEQALKAEVLFSRDKEYVVEENEVVIIDEFTGRKMPGRRFSEGLHQAIEAKENVKIQRESQTLATITFQNLFRMYTKLSGMTGTAETEEEEFQRIYTLDVVVIPTNRPNARLDQPDRIYKHERAKFQAVAEQIRICREKGQPILIGTISVEKNEKLSEYLRQVGIDHEVLNAKNHEREGEIIAQAGRPGAVTLATNVAGRGVDIKLGGTPADPEIVKQVQDAGGLFVLGTERHESRRIDNQLRGRAGRQGDPGETQFYVSTDDDLMRIFAGDRLKSVMDRLNVPENMPVEQPIISRILENAQKKVEGHNFDIRKHLLDYDDVLNKHRAVIYKKRRAILELALAEHDGGSEKFEFSSLKNMILQFVETEIEHVVSFHTQTPEVELGEETSQDWNIDEICQTMKTLFHFTAEDEGKLREISKHGQEKMEEIEARNKMVEFLFGRVEEEYQALESKIASLTVDAAGAQDILRSLEKSVLLRSFDTLWVEHLVSIDYLRTGIGLRGYGQRDPLIEYKKEAYNLFQVLLQSIEKEVVYTFFKMHPSIEMAPSIMASDKLVQEGASKTSTAAVNTADTPKKKESKKERRKRQRLEKQKKIS